MEREHMNVGFVGLGKMGVGIATRILSAGFSLAVWNRSPAPCKQLVDAGARGASTARELAAAADVVLTCLTGDEAILEVLHDGLGDPKYRPCPLLRKYVAAGWLGRKSKRGFYAY